MNLRSYEKKAIRHIITSMILFFSPTALTSSTSSYRVLETAINLATPRNGSLTGRGPRDEFNAMLTRPTFTDSDTLPLSHLVTGKILASKHNPEGIEITISIDSFLLTQYRVLSFDIYRIKEGSYDTTKIEHNLMDKSAMDKGAEENVEYEYIAEVYFQGMKKGRLIRTDEKAVGIKPGKNKVVINLRDMKAVEFGKDIYISWTFHLRGIKESDVLKYHLQVMRKDDHKWNKKAGFNENRKVDFEDHVTPNPTLVLPNRPRIDKIWISIKVIYRDGSTDYFYKALEVSKPDQVLNGFEKEELLIEDPILQKYLRVVKELEPHKTYGLSYIPLRLATYRNKLLSNTGQDNWNERVKDSLSSPSVIRHSEELLSLSSSMVQQTACLRSYQIEENYTCKARAMPSTHYLEENLKLALLSNCVDYEMNSLKLEVRVVNSKDGTVQKELVLEPNDLAMISKFRKTQGAFVWVELPKNNSLNNDMIRKLQNKLLQMGYYVGKVDGAMNTRLRLAIIQYQQSQQLPLGNLDVGTLKSLDMELD